MVVDQEGSRDANPSPPAAEAGTGSVKNEGIEINEPASPTHNKDDDAATTGVQDNTAQTGASRKRNHSTKSWLSGAKLYCRVTGRCHAELVEYGIFQCPLCRENLRRPKSNSKKSNRKDAQSDSDVTESDSDETESDSDETESDSEESPSLKKEPRQDLSAPGDGFLYSIEYRDASHAVLGTQPWNGIFDLASARQGAGRDASSVFEVDTVLETSVPGDAIRSLPRQQKLIKDLLQKSDIEVTVASTRLNIKSTPLIQTIRPFVRYYPSVNLDSSVLQLHSPFPIVAHHYKQLNNYRVAHAAVESEEGDDENQTTTGIKHLGMLLGYYEKTVLPDVVEEEARYDRGLCTFRMLWLLYKPGDTVYLETEGLLSAYVIKSVGTDPAILTTAAPKRPRSYTVEVWNLAYDGQYVGRTATTVTVAPFEGERRIVSLRLIPCAPIDKEDGGKKRRSLEENGRRWYRLLPGGQAYYSGPLLDANNRELHGRVYIDPASFYSQQPLLPPGPHGFMSPPNFIPTPSVPRRYPGNSNTRASDITPVDDFGGEAPAQDTHPRGPMSPVPGMNHGRNEEAAKCQCEDCRGLRPHPPHGFPWTQYDILDPTVEQDLEIPGASEGSLHRYLLCQRRLPGFDLKSRTWVGLNIEYCRPVKANLRAIDSLVMPEDRLNMIKALIQKFTSTEPGKAPHRAWAADFIENKGEGQIFLLHGSPGVGKTYTAGKSSIIQYNTGSKLTTVECIAEYTERPLLSLTCGDIGTDEIRMEWQLSRWFRLAEKWGAVMLIDEADVYLERRHVADLKRNSLVSVFLRCIEYYRGVLFLTTNRVGQFDDAFISRIHVIIRYENLSAESRRKIWAHFFDKLDDEREDFKTTRRAKDYVLGDGEISQMEWNGREIRNAFQTAVALAEFRFLQNRDSSKTQPILDQRDFEQVLNMMQQFKTYLVKVHGSNEEERAYGARSRAPPYLE